MVENKNNSKLDGNFEARSINAEHKDLIHDVAYDFYGQRMATCSSDQHVKVWDLNEKDEWQLTSNWKAHSGSVWKVTWAHPDFGQVIATCSFDRTAAVWEEIVGEGALQKGERGLRHWVRRTNLVDSRTSVTDVKFAPKQLGLVLATCSTDGIIRVYEAPDMMNLSQWTLQHEVVNKLSCSCITWNSSLSRTHPPMLAVGSDDVNRSAGGKVSIHEYSEAGRKWTRTETLTNLLDPVHDIAFAPNMGRSYHMLAIAAKEVRVYTMRETSSVNGPRYEIEQAAQLEDHGCSVWRVGWNVTGTLLASSGDDGCVRLWKSNYKSAWKSVGVLRGNGTVEGEVSAPLPTVPIQGVAPSRYLKLSSITKQFS